GLRLRRRIAERSDPRGADPGAGRRIPAGATRRIFVVISRYSRPEMARIWSDEGKLERWLEVELAALDGWAEAGVVPGDAAESIRATAVAPSPERVAESEQRTHPDTAPIVHTGFSC